MQPPKKKKKKKTNLPEIFSSENAHVLELYWRVKIIENNCYDQCKDFLFISLNYLFWKYFFIY